jgi:hypothetical protein
LFSEIQKTPRYIYILVERFYQRSDTIFCWCYTVIWSAALGRKSVPAQYQDDHTVLQPFRKRCTGCSQAASGSWIHPQSGNQADTPSAPAPTLRGRSRTRSPKAMSAFMEQVMQKDKALKRERALDRKFCFLSSALQIFPDIPAYGSKRGHRQSHSIKCKFKV